MTSDVNQHGARDRSVADPLTQLRDELILAHHEIVRLQRLVDNLTATHHQDLLTGLMNRAGFEAAFAREWLRAIRSALPIGLIFVDLDAFKPINDRFGHAAGDDALRAVASVIGTEAKRSGEIAARYGGDEFVVIAPQAAVEGAVRLGARIAENVARIEFVCRSERIPLRVSVGAAASAPQRGSSREELLRAADEAMYRAKRSRPRGGP